jgi:hydroxypyruvate isomerase
MPDPALERYSACIELLFAEPGAAFGDRIRRAADAGFSAVEFWQWRNKDLNDIETALRDTGMALTAIVAEPMIWLTDPANHDAFLAGLKASAETASRLGAPILIAQAGNDRAGVPRPDQRAAIAAVLGRAADVLAGTGIVLALEPLNDRVDHPGYYLTSTVEALDIVDEVNRPEIRVLYDIYHSAVMDEVTEAVIADRIDRVAHVHLADHPGRHEPGSGALDWRHRIEWLRQAGYRGRIGLEYKPSGRPSGRPSAGFPIG